MAGNNSLDMNNNSSGVIDIQQIINEQVKFFNNKSQTERVNLNLRQSSNQFEVKFAENSYVSAQVDNTRYKIQ